MSDIESSEVEVRNGFDLMRSRLEAEYNVNVAKAREMGSLSILSSLQSMYQEFIAQISAAEAELKAYYESAGRQVGNIIAAACVDEGLSDDVLITLAKEVVFRVNGGVSVSDIVDEMFVQRPEDETFLIGSNEAVSLTHNGLNYRIAEHLGLM